MSENMKVQRISEFKKGTNVFVSTGISKVKTTIDGDIVCIEVPIKSSGIADLIDSFNRSAPIPPSKNVMVNPEDELGMQMKLTKKTWIKMPDLTDQDYLHAKEEHDSDLGIAIVLKGLAVDIKDEEDNIITEEREKIKILRSMGMSGDQFSQIVRDITDLTRWTEEERQRFLE